MMTPSASRTAPPDPSRPWITDLLPADMRWSMLMASARSPAAMVDRMRREPGLLAECLALVTAIPSLRPALAALGDALGPSGPALPWLPFLDTASLGHHAPRVSA